MDETVQCPFCQAHLTLPGAPEGQVVQCPRCGRDFEPSRRRAKAPAPASAPAARPREPRSAEPLGGEWRTTLALALVVGCSLTFAIQLFVNLMRMSLISEMEEANFQGNFNGNFFPVAFDLDDRWDYWEQAAGRMASFTLFVFGLTAIGFFLWLYQTSDNLRLLHADGLTHGPGAAVFSFFIPIVNFVRPCTIVQEISQASDPRAVRSARAWKSSPSLRSVTFWWLSFLAASFLAIFGLWSGSHDNGLETQRIVLFFWCASNLAMIVSGILLIVVITTLEQRQQQRYANLLEDDA